MPITPSFPAPLPAWATWLLRAAPFVWAVGEALTEHTSDIDVEELEWRKVVLSWTRPTPATTTEDIAQISMEFVNITSGDVDTSWTSGDYAALESLLDTWYAAVDNHISADFELVDYRWYRRAFADPMSTNHRFAESGPPERVTVKGTNGALVGTPLPFQVAATVTEKTSVPGHWGRFYMPGLCAESTDTGYGRLDSGYRTAVANATAQLYNDAQEAEFFPVVAVTQVNKVLSPALLGVTEVQVDDIPDVQRRRRAREAEARTIGTYS